MSWEDLEKKPDPASAEQAEWARLHAAVFASGPGRDLLERYHRMIVDRASGAGASDALLRHADAQRALIRSMEILTAQGQSAKT